MRHLGIKDKIPETVITDQVALFINSMRPELNAISATFALAQNRHFVKDIEEGTSGKAIKTVVILQYG